MGMCEMDDWLGSLFRFLGSWGVLKLEERGDAGDSRV